MTVVSLDQVRQLQQRLVDPMQAEHEIYRSQGRVFYVKFIKENGDVREMIARTGVKKWIKGPFGACRHGVRIDPAKPGYAQDKCYRCDVVNGFPRARGASCDPADHGNVRVADMGVLGYRTIPLGAILELRVNGKVLRGAGAR